MNKDLLWGLLTLAGFAGFCIFSHAGKIETKLAETASLRLADAGMGFARVEPDGRGLALMGIALNEEARRAAEALAVEVWGVRAVDNRLTLSPAPEAPSLQAREAVQEEINRVLTSSVIEFESGSDRLTAAGRAVVERVGEVLLRSPGAAARIAGHTDSQGPAGLNLDLSHRRAAAVLQALVDQGVEEARLRSEGFGETRPISDNSTPEGRLENRRVEIEVE